LSPLLSSEITTKITPEIGDKTRASIFIHGLLGSTPVSWIILVQPVSETHTKTDWADRNAGCEFDTVLNQLAEEEPNHFLLIHLGHPFLPTFTKEQYAGDTGCRGRMYVFGSSGILTPPFVPTYSQADS